MIVRTRASARPVRRVRRTAFTLVELLVVVAMLVVLAGIGGITYVKYLDSSKVTAARLQAKAISGACEAYYVTNTSYPANLQVLTERGADGSRPALEPDALKTPWGGTYQYDPNGPNNGGNKPDVWADGPGGQRIGNWPGG